MEQELEQPEQIQDEILEEAQKLKDFIARYGDVQHIENLREFGKSRSDYATQMQEEDFLERFLISL